ncbi:hypothetical protein [Gillisia sp. JM1]|uniref:hypothetical protein n=1 Tax=Gillisia sp. JM1 TaxID=1283286 RepID=UPI00047AF8F5|nr:hypothetical protein [Gillisia sp. JM1]
MADFLKQSGLAFLGDSGTYILGALLALLELAAGISLDHKQADHICVCIFSICDVNGISTCSNPIRKLDEHYDKYCFNHHVGWICNARKAKG